MRVAQEVLRDPIITDSGRVCWLCGRGRLTPCSAVDELSLGELGPRLVRLTVQISGQMHSIECAGGSVVTVVLARN